MKIKAISFAVLSSLLLTACGGGGGSDSYTGGNGNNDNTTPDTSANQQWSILDIGEVNSAPYEGPLGYEENRITLKDGKYYVKQTNTLNDSDSLYLSFTVTKDGVYEDGPISQDGALIGTVSINANKWTLLPYSKIGSTGLKFYHTYKTIDISGQSFNQVIAPLHMWAIKNGRTNDISASNAELKFYAANTNTKFPSGSTCLQLIKEENNQEYIELEIESENDPYVINRWNDFALAGSGAEQKIFKDTTAYITSQDDNEDDNADMYAKYQNKYFAGNYTAKGIQFDFEDLLKELSESSKALTGQDKVIANEYIDAVKNTCMLYNDKATQTILNAIKNAN